MQALPFIAVALSAIGTVTAVAGAAQAGDAQQAAEQYNAQVDAVKAQEAQNQAASQAAIDQQTTRRNIGQISAAYGAGGVDASGTPLSVMMDQTTQGEMQRQLDLYRGNTNSMSDLQQATLDTASGAAAASAGAIKAGSTLMTGAGSTANSLNTLMATPNAGSNMFTTGQVGSLT